MCIRDRGKNGAIADILGWRLDDTVAIIRGEPDTIVLLDILPVDTGPDGKHKRVSLTRKMRIRDRAQDAVANISRRTSGYSSCLSVARQSH